MEINDPSRYLFICLLLLTFIIVTLMTLVARLS